MTVDFEDEGPFADVPTHAALALVSLEHKTDAADRRLFNRIWWEQLPTRAQAGRLTPARVAAIDLR